MNPSFFSKPAVFASIGDAAGAGAVAAGCVEDAQPAMTPAAAAIESIEALFIGFAFEDGRLSHAADLRARGNGSVRRRSGLLPVDRMPGQAQLPA